MFGVKKLIPDICLVHRNLLPEDKVPIAKVKVNNIMNLRVLLINLGCAILSATAISAQNNNVSEDPKTLPQTQWMDERISELMADRVPVKKDIALKELIESNERIELLKTESIMFPADELYGSHWENKWVNPFRGDIKVTFPDSCAIDCSSFIIPLDTELKVTSKFGPRRRRMHNGIDLKIQVGDTIRVAFDGKVRIRSYERKGYGNYLVVRHPNGLETIYGHLSKFLVDENDIVRAGQVIGLGGNTGRSTGPHLHFETRFLGQPINPAEIVDFVNGVPHQDMYVFRNVKINGRNSNIYTSSESRMVYHRVKSGDMLGTIARKYGTSVNEICRLNGIKSTTTLRIGQSLRVSTTAEPKTTQASQAGQADTPKTTTVKASTAAVAALPENTSTTINTEEKDPVYHKIQQDDTLGALAIKYGTTVEKLCQLNGITRTTVLRLGRKIRCS